MEVQSISCHESLSRNNEFFIPLVKFWKYQVISGNYLHKIKNSTNIYFPSLKCQRETLLRAWEIFNPQQKIFNQRTEQRRMTRTVASAELWSHSSPTSSCFWHCPYQSGAVSRWCRSMRELSSSDWDDSSLVEPRDLVSSSSYHALTPTGKHQLSFMFIFIYRRKYFTIMNRDNYFWWINNCCIIVDSFPN